MLLIFLQQSSDPRIKLAAQRAIVYVPIKGRFSYVNKKDCGNYKHNNDRMGSVLFNYWTAAYLLHVVNCSHCNIDEQATAQQGKVGFPPPVRSWPRFSRSLRGPELVRSSFFIRPKKTALRLPSFYVEYNFLSPGSVLSTIAESFVRDESWKTLQKPAKENLGKYFNWRNNSLDVGYPSPDYYTGSSRCKVIVKLQMLLLHKKFTLHSVYMWDNLLQLHN